jgi:hypothetical protein
LSRLRVQWSLDGHAVAAWSEHLLVGFISAGERRGFSRLLAASGPWGAPLDMRLYERLFPADQG